MPARKEDRRGPAVLGVILVLVGALFLATNVTGFQLAAAWPLFIIVPGLILLAASFAAGGDQHPQGDKAGRALRLLSDQLDQRGVKLLQLLRR